MKTPHSDLKNQIIPQNRLQEEFYEASVVDTDFGDTNLLENINSTPIGQLLKLISSLPEIRHEKVSHIRERIDRNQYELSDNLDVALDMVIEELIAEN